VWSCDIQNGEVFYEIATGSFPGGDGNLRWNDLNNGTASVKSLSARNRQRSTDHNSVLQLLSTLVSCLLTLIPLHITAFEKPAASGLAVA